MNMAKVAQISNLISRLERWRNARERINAREERVGKPLPNDELTEAISLLYEYVCTAAAKGEA